MARDVRFFFVMTVAAVLTALTGCTAAMPAPSAPESSTDTIFSDSTVGPLIEALPTRSVATLGSTRLAVGLIPPTNRWFSGLVFGEDSLPVFPLPLSFQLTGGGFALGVPAVVSAENVIAGGFTPAVSADIGADDYVVSAYDEASVTISQTAGGNEIGTTVIAEGSPFVSFTASEAVAVTLGQPLRDDDGAWTAEVNGTQYGLVSDGEMNAAGSELTLAAGDAATWFAVSDGGVVADFIQAATPIVSTSIQYTVDAAVASTSIRYETRDSSPTIVAAMPHQGAGLDSSVSCDAGSWPSIYGELVACMATELTWTVPTIEPAGALDLANLTEEHRERLRQQLNVDVASTVPAPADTYYGGKWLYRLTNMLEVARQIGADDIAATITEQLVSALDTWTDPEGCDERTERCFVYDDQARGLVGLAASFGSDQFNDHHFHYGYFLYTAGVLAAADPALVEKWAPVMNLLAADIAAQGENSYFPERRVFDAYAGHSWASGTSPFADGNNQESSSEAVSAWNGLALWAAASDQAALATEARWMLSAEAHSANAYWTNFDRTEAVYDGFDHTVAALNWGGKRDYATWFSAEPSAMLGILVLPMSPVSGYLAADPDRLRANIAEAAPDGSDVLFGDYLLMYSALAGKADAAAALEESDNLNEDRIDDGNSRTYLLATIMSAL
ncbi:1,3-beta-glucanase [Salinibacterium sp. NSLL150]|uniref:glycosyl hydrolase n=1 Tax=unclassified Salinibacterium TaxID=2632331 RepID=UPI0018CF4066|nr:MULTISPECIES: glycosyl hydrolase [unclassified Salinibacterium]MBH0098936.1 1,3-beta-glucanase [Salinibacterium sp. NSLL35]MBH0101691.1 1,3-beta-glucanase [Salinibacterium sp. NSLL150]MBH0104450.1 1,3-beta-glucanase [Salinibacterium sp. NSLL16]